MAIPFNFKGHREECEKHSERKLKRELQHHTRVLVRTSVMASVSIAAAPLTAGMSAIGLVPASLSITNSAKKHRITKQTMKELEYSTKPRMRDIALGVLIGGTCSVAGLAFAGMGIDHVALVACDLVSAAVVHCLDRGVEKADEKMDDKAKKQG
jgi:hypothetical protein